ncbi:prolyl 4-hydroxylase alpha-subunit [Fragilaria crotonensis]|nr:prolyl 4-hydroxylase alpha-subunit [Fragilaria crotonensis]
MDSSSIVIINNNNDDNDSHVNITIQVPQYYYDDSNNNNNSKKKSHDYPSLLHNIHVEPLLSLTEAATCLELAKRYGQDTGKWNTPDYQRHTNYATCDFSVLMDVHEDHDDDDENDTNGAPELHSYLMNDLDFQSRIFTRLSQAYSVDYDDLLGFIDLFCVNYVAKSNDGNGDDFEDNDDENDNPNDVNNIKNDQTMDRLEAHRDGSILSFTVLLTPPDEFEGGGTFFDALRLNGGSTMENDGDESQRQSS